MKTILWEGCSIPLLQEIIFGWDPYSSWNKILSIYQFHESNYVYTITSFKILNDVAIYTRLDP